MNDQQMFLCHLKCHWQYTLRGGRRKASNRRKKVVETVHRQKANHFV